MNRPGNYDRDVQQALEFAREEARRLRHRLISTEHLLLGLLKLNNPLVEGLLASLHTSTGRIQQALDFVIGRGHKAILSGPIFGAPARITLQRAEEEAARARADLVSAQHLFLAILHERDGIAGGVLESFDVSVDSVRQKLKALLEEDYDHLQLAVHYQVLYDKTPTLNLVSRDLTIAALHDEIDPMIGRTAELERAMQILARRSKNNPVLVGAAGVGKTAIAEGLALRIVNDQVPEHLQHCRLVALDVGLLTVGTKFRGDFEERLKLIMHEIISNTCIIIFIDELQAFVHTGVAEGSVDASNLLKPMLARGEFRCIGATTLEGYRKTIETDPALERRFQPISIAETNFSETLTILRGLQSRYESFHHVKISEEALIAAVQLSMRYIQGRYLPDKALDLLDEAASRLCVRNSIAPQEVVYIREKMVKVQREKDHAIVQRDFPRAAQALKAERQLLQELWRVEQVWHDSNRGCPVLNKQHIAEIVMMQTGIPVVQTAEEESHRLFQLECELHKRVIGQTAAIQTVSSAVRRSRVGLRDHRRPVGSFLFVGPTGVGKTELARVLAETLFGDERAMLKLDMSEFIESHTTSRLIGAPPGYIGYDQAGQLTEAVRRRPYSIVLFDEIEKAHPKVLDLLLQILEDGRLSDARGQTIDFKSTIIIITSNVGTMYHSAGSMKFTIKYQDEKKSSHHIQIHERIIAAIQDIFQPELLNRLDDIVFFHALEQEHLYAIVNLMIKQLQQRLALQSITLRVSDAVYHLLVKCGYDPAFGARSLRRAIQRMLEDILADALLQGKLSPGDEALVDVECATGDTLKIAIFPGARTPEQREANPTCKNSLLPAFTFTRS